VASTEGIGLASPAGELVQRYQGGIGPRYQGGIGPRYQGGIGPRYQGGIGPRYQGEREQRFPVASTLGRPEVQRCHFEAERRCLGDSPILE